MEVIVDYLFSKSREGAIGSKVIIEGTRLLAPELPKDEVPSHVAILVNNRWVFESTLESGVKRIEYKKWLKKNVVVKKIPCLKKWDLSKIIEIFKNIRDKKYDYPAIVYFSWRMMLFIAFKKKLPSANKFNSEDKYFCCEAVGEMTGCDYQMTAPVVLMLSIEEAVKNPSQH